jgi:redox-sensitive bicupin YhaK (pirin superfamily)
MGFRTLRVINEDRVAAGQGFGQHGHRDMEILYVISTARSSTRTRWARRRHPPGDVQCMSAGTGVLHSEFNASKTDPVHFLQIWVLPDVASAEPRYDQKSFGNALAKGGLVTLASKDGGERRDRDPAEREAPAARADEGRDVRVPAPGRSATAGCRSPRGNVRVNDVDLGAGDGSRDRARAADHDPSVEGRGVLAIRSRVGQRLRERTN